MRRKDYYNFDCQCSATINVCCLAINILAGLNKPEFANIIVASIQQYSHSALTGELITSKGAICWIFWLNILKHVSSYIIRM